MISDSYQTIDLPSEGMYKEKGSKFISFAYPIESEDEIKEILAEIRKINFSARHCCYAWCFGIAQEKYRVNDDGEPSGTGGRPIFGQIQSNGLTNILIVVVRYFGGTLLGVSGLIQAYKQAALDAIVNANIVTRNYEETIEILFDYSAMNNIMHLIKEEQLEIVTSKFDLQCLIRFKVRLARVELIEALFAQVEGVYSCKKIE